MAPHGSAIVFGRGPATGDISEAATRWGARLLTARPQFRAAGPVETDTGKQTGTAAWRAVTATCRTVGARQGSSSFNAHHGRHILSPGGSQMLDPSYRPPPPFPGQTDRWLRDRDQQPPRAADDVRERGDSGRPGGPL